MPRWSQEISNKVILKCPLLSFVFKELSCSFLANFQLFLNGCLQFQMSSWVGRERSSWLLISLKPSVFQKALKRWSSPVALAYHQTLPDARPSKTTRSSGSPTRGTQMLKDHQDGLIPCPHRGSGCRDTWFGVTPPKSPHILWFPD